MAAHRLDVVVEPLAVLLREHVREVAVVAIADLGRVIALEPHLVDAVEPLLGPHLGLVAERRRELHRARRRPAHLLDVRGPTLVERAALAVVLERLLGIESEQAQARVEAVDADRVAVDHLRELELADREARRLEPRQRLLRLLARVAVGVSRAARPGCPGGDDRDEGEGEEALHGHARFAC